MKFYQQQIFACDSVIENELASLESKGNQTGTPATNRKGKTRVV